MLVLLLLLLLLLAKGFDCAQGVELTLGRKHRVTLGA